MNVVVSLAVVVCVYVLFCERASCERKTFIWIQHPDVPDYYEHLLNERARCKKAHVGRTTRLIKRIAASIGKKSPPKPPPSPSESSSPHHSDLDEMSTTSRRRRFLHSDNANCRMTALEANEKALQRAQSFAKNKKRSLSAPHLPAIPPEEGYRYLRSSSTIESYKTSSRSRYRALPFLDQNMCPFHRKSFIKKMDTAGKQELCDADLVLFAFLDDHVHFSEVDADAQRGSRIENDLVASVHHPVLHRDTYNINNQCFIENLPMKKKRKLFRKKKKKRIQKKDENPSNQPASEERKKRKKRKKKNKERNENGDKSAASKKDYVQIFVGTRPNPTFVKAVPCIIYQKNSWFLVDGYARDQYFTVEKDYNERFFRVTGMLDATATVSVDVETKAPLSPSKLESSFRKMQTWIVNSNSRVDLCILDDILKFRLCSVVYAAWQQQVEGTVGKYNFSRGFREKDCIGNIFLKSKVQKDAPVSDIPVFLVPCMVNSDEPAFYMTASEDSNSVFIVTSSSPSPPINGKDYFLHLHITNINLLRNIARQTLLSTYKKNSKSDSPEQMLGDNLVT